MFIHNVTLIFLPNAHQVVLCNRDIVERATPVTRLDRLPLPPNAVGPEATAFDPAGGGPYTGVTDGRILKWAGPSMGFLDFAVTSEIWPLDLGFYNKLGLLYIADAYNNLRSVDLKGGIATLVASSAEGLPFKFPNALDVDQHTGIVYFTDASSQFEFRDAERATLIGETSGRLMEYNPTTKQVTVLLRDLGLANGAAISKDGKFVLVSEFWKSRIRRYWLKGPKANSSEIFVTFPRGTPDNIKRNADGDFWVALSIGTQQNAIPLGILNFAAANISVLVSNVQEYDGKLYIGSIGLNYVGVTRNTRG
ncbi:hypothetical protein V2J09_014903 [Rumex salicifolius]